MKSLLKKMATWLSLAIVFPIAGAYLITKFFSKSDSSFTAYSQMLCLLPGKTGSYIRVAFYRYAMTHCSPDVFISFLAIFSHADTELESGIYIGPACNIGLSRIQRNTLLGSGVHIMSGKGQHRFSDPALPVKDQGGEFEKVIIGEDCWIGNGAMIMASLGNKCIVGAGSVVTSDIPPNSIIAGNPAKIIGQRE